MRNAMIVDGRGKHVWIAPIRAMMVACVGLSLLSQGAAAQEVKLNEVLRSLFYAPQHVALRIGAFEQEGLKIVGPKTTWGVQAALTEIVSGASNIALMGPEAAALTQEASPERRLVNFAQLTNGDGSFILSKNPMPNFKIADLKGKTIVTAGKGATPALVLVDLIKKAGLDPNKDVTIRNIPISANIIPSYLEPNTRLCAGVRADGRAGGQREAGSSRGVGRRAARPDAVHLVHGVGELHREEPGRHPVLHQRRSTRG